jgi:dUTP pyrophosphatase
MKKVLFKKLNPRATIPQYATPHSAGMDLTLVLHPDLQDLWIVNGDIQMLSTGLAIEMPNNMEAQIRPRSGLSLKFPNYLVNSPGTIDADYRGEIMIPFINNARHTAVLSHGERIAQIIFSRVVHAEIIETDILTNTKRDTGGFGHTGRR